MPGDRLTIREAEDLTQLEPMTINMMAETGEVTMHVAGGKRLFDRQALLDAMGELHCLEFYYKLRRRVKQWEEDLLCGRKDGLPPGSAR